MPMADDQFISKAQMLRQKNTDIKRLRLELSRAEDDAKRLRRELHSDLFLDVPGGAFDQND